jgi:hypothetical protein
VILQKERGVIEKKKKSICSRSIGKKCAPIKEHIKKERKRKHDPPPK